MFPLCYSHRKKILKITGISVYGTPGRKSPPSSASYIIKSPIDEKALAVINNDVYVVTIPYTGVKDFSINVSKPESSSFPARKLTKFGGEFASWGVNGDNVYFSLGKSLFNYNIPNAKADEERISVVPVWGSLIVVTPYAKFAAKDHVSVL